MNNIYFLNRKYLEEQFRMSAYDYNYLGQQQYNYQQVPYTPTVTKAAALPVKKVCYGTGLYDYLFLNEQQLTIVAESAITAHLAFEDDKRAALVKAQVEAQLKAQQEAVKRAEAEKEAKRQAELKRVFQPGERVSYVDDDATGKKKFGVVAAPGTYTPFTASYLSGDNVVWAYWGDNKHTSYMPRKNVSYAGSK